MPGWTGSIARSARGVDRRLRALGLCRASRACCCCELGSAGWRWVPRRLLGDSSRTELKCKSPGGPNRRVTGTTTTTRATHARRTDAPYALAPRLSLGQTLLASRLPSFRPSFGAEPAVRAARRSSSLPRLVGIYLCSGFRAQLRCFNCGPRISA